MKHHSRVRSLTGSIMRLFSTKNGVNPNKRYPNAYYRHYYLSKPLCDGIDMVAAVELTSKKEAAELIVKVGLSSYMGGKLSEFIRNEKIAGEQNQKVRMTRFIMLLKR